MTDGWWTFWFQTNNVFTGPNTALLRFPEPSAVFSQVLQPPVEISKIQQYFVSSSTRMVPKTQAGFSLKECWWCLKVWEEGRPPVPGERSDLAPSWSAQTLPFLPRSKSTGQHQVLPRSHFLHKLHRIIEIIITTFTIFLGSSPQLSLISYGYWSVLFCGLNGLVWSQNARVHDIHLIALHPDIFVLPDKHRANSYLIFFKSQTIYYYY